jgi:hypothetical protein
MILDFTRAREANEHIDGMSRNQLKNDNNVTKGTRAYFIKILI